MKIQDLAKIKTKCLFKLLMCSQKFMAVLEKKTSTVNLKEFQESRESILKAYALFDRKITQYVLGLSEADKQNIPIEMLRKEDEMQKQLISSILKIDNTIIKNLEVEKEKIEDELIESDKNKNIVNRFKSKWVPESGEKIDWKL